jgi:hypothetical protein
MPLSPPGSYSPALQEQPMKRAQKTVFTDDKGRELISIKDCKVSIECGYRNFTPDELDELASAASAAADELRSMQPAIAEL